MTNDESRESFEESYKKHYDTSNCDFAFDDDYHGDATLKFAFEIWKIACCHQEAKTIEECSMVADRCSDLYKSRCLESNCVEFGQIIAEAIRSLK